MNFFTLLLKKTNKRWLNVIPIILVSLFVVLLYYGNNNGAFYLANTATHESQLKGWKADVEYFTENLKNYEPNTKEYNETKQNLNIAKEGLKISEIILRAFENGDWKEYYENSIKFTDKTLKSLAKSEGINTENYRAIELNKKYKEYMANHNLSFDDRFSPIQGISFMASMILNYLPIILAILVAFITSTMYCANLVDKMDIHDVIPMSKLKKQCTKLVVGLFYGVMIVSYVSIFSLLCGSLMQTFGSFQSPILMYTIDGASQYVAFRSIMPQLLILIVLSTLFVVNMVSVIACITKRNLTCFLVASALILGLMWVTTNIVPLSSYIHMFPTTYLNWVKVLNGELINTVRNTNITFMNGVIVLGISNIVLFLICNVLKKSFKEMKSHDGVY